MTTVTQADIVALTQASDLINGVLAGWAMPPVVTPPIPPVVTPPIVVPPDNGGAGTPPPVYETLPTFKSGSAGAWQVYDLRGKFYKGQLNLRRLSYVHVLGGTFETSDTSFYVDGGSDLIVEAATFTGTPLQSSNSQRCRIINSARVTMDTCIIIGGLANNGIPQTQLPPLDGTGNVLGLGAGKGINLDNCIGCIIRNCDISLVMKGITVGKSTVEVADNVIHDIRTSPISGVFGSGSVILGNETRDSLPWQYGGAGDHGDMLHIWTEGGDTSNLVISDNRFTQGAGAPIMGIFLQAKNGGFPNLTAYDNYVSTANGQGWRVDGCSGLIANTVLHWPGDHADPKSEPRLDVNIPSHDLTVNNTMGIVTVDKGLRNITVNGVIQP